MIEVICDECHKKFQVQDNLVTTKTGHVRFNADATCPHCHFRYHDWDRLDLAGVQGQGSGVNFSGVKNLNIGGDVIGGSAYYVNGKRVK